MKYLSVLIICVCCISCNKYLDVKPSDKFLDDQVFSNKYSIQAALTGIYINLAKTDLYGANLSSTTVDAMAQYYNVSNTNHRLNAAGTFTYTSATAQTIFSNIWTDAYAAILNLNVFAGKLAETNLPTLTAKEKNTMTGEALALKAMLGFDMLRLFGPVYKTDSLVTAVPYPSSTGNLTTVYMSAATLIDSLLSDMSKALVLLENDPVRTEGVINPNGTTADNFYLGRNRRMNYYAALALTARMHLYRGNKVLAYQFARRVISEAQQYFPWSVPVSNPASLDRVFSSELLFAPENIDMYNTYNAWFLNDGGLLPYYDAAAGADRLMEVYERMENDYRYRYWWDYSATSGVSVKTFFKFSQPGTLNNTFRYMQPLIKMSEMYLIAAESTTRTDSAAYFMNQLQFNRGIQDLPAGFTLATEIEKAYQKEFWGEGQLFFFYKRVNKTSVKSGGSAATIGLSKTQYVVPLPLTESQFR